MTANTNALDVVGDNLANMNTQGFKSNSIQFEDAMNQASATLQIGDGVGSTNTVRNFSQGTIQTTSGPLDAAIQGNGFFVVQDSSGNTMYTRDGSFTLNSSGQLVTQSGELVQGWNAVNGVVNPSGSLSGITVPLNCSLRSLLVAAPRTSRSAPTWTRPPRWATTFSAPVQVVDSLGETHTLNVTFTSTGSNGWNYEVDIPGQDLTGGKAGTETSIGKGMALPAFSQLELANLDDSGGRREPVALTNATALARRSAADADEHQLESLRFHDANSNSDGDSSYGAGHRLSSGSTQDGIQAATVTGVSLENGGMLVANFSNGTTQTLAQARASPRFRIRIRVDRGAEQQLYDFTVENDPRHHQHRR